ncbi:site-2 protease family protein [soil metagenome]
MISVLQALPPFAAVLLLVVTVHELGHFLMAKAMGVSIDQFSIGFGKAILKWRDKSGVEWRLGWIPLGGFVKFSGDADAASTLPDASETDRLRRQVAAHDGAAATDRLYHCKPVWARALVVAAGPAANFLLAAAIFAGLLMALGETVLPPRVAQVAAQSTAERAGLLPGDLIDRLDGRATDSFDDVQRYVRIRAGDPIRFGVDRAGRSLELTATPDRRIIRDEITGRALSVGILGFVPAAKPTDFRHVRYGPVQAVAKGVDRTREVLNTTVFYISRIFRGRESGDQIGGLMGTAQMSGKLAKAAAAAAPTFGGAVLNVGLNLLSLAAVISVGIGFMNLLPVPILDGGHLMFYAYEALARRPLDARVQAVGYRVGLALIVGLMLFATWNDVRHLSLFRTLGAMFG